MRQTEHKLERWNPLIDVPFYPQHVEETIHDFGAVVDRIEGGEFTPPPLERLMSRQPGTNAVYAVNVCRNCDARFSCSSYRDYARQSSRGAEQRFRQYMDDFGEDAECSERVLASLPPSP